MNFMYGKEVAELLLLNTINTTYSQFADAVDLAYKYDLVYAAGEFLYGMIDSKTDVHQSGFDV
jgi:hypothetical protein